MKIPSNSSFLATQTVYIGYDSLKKMTPFPLPFYSWACAKSWSGVLETPSWSGVLKTLSWSVVYDFSVDVFCKLGIDK